ncbi:MAG: bifunctional (p)ppGpp synthetase/guanosine-3',5'-bis(diphosphate) 3'-pyrophosphohydrolase [Bacteroidales bacterium]|nr:bifunctional (p)ppGpp synthetase/guanosine-3',5'-bis(diphosphate) 3'-pyrophosphohydrolase [Bacteroidales bacterium]MBQ4306453.1 bifunctional (p)ppGpp synthetase/guanosine-3',5'-bis(diphosphate) 3'-pyrophosphohydrolase [Bacteroidales bacterium]
MSFSQFTEQDHELIRREYGALAEAAAKRCANEREFAVVQKAFDFANEAHKNVRRRSGEPYIIHPIAVARIVVSDIGLGYKSISAALLHDVVEDTQYTVEDIKSLFGDKIASLVDGLTKIKVVLDNEEKNKKNDISSQSLQAENFKRILLTLNDDVRVVLIKLADRLHNCRTIEFMPEYKRDKILSETMFIFIPLAHRLGLYGIKSEMEDIWLKYKEPGAYNELSGLISRNVSDKSKEIDDFIAPIDTALTQAGFSFEIRKRVKSPYSIWKKMQSKNIPFDQVYDLYAVRIIFDPSSDSKETERDQCYHIFSIITGIYRYKPDRIRDWVKHPKSNGYEALHCTVLGERGIWIEVQIRSRRMNDIAEKGIAAHWAYKKNGYIGENDSEMDKWLAKVKEILVNPDVNALELLDIIHNDLTSSEIVVFTPKGEQKTVPKGSTALDFAYQIHSEIGNHAIAAKVNMKLVPLSQILKTGDQVEIISAEDGQPRREWFQFLITRRARSIVSDWFKSHRSETVDAGKSIMEEQLSILGIKPTEDNIRKIHQALGFPGETDIEEMYYRTGSGAVKVEDIAATAREFKEEKTGWSFPWFRRSSSSDKDKEKDKNQETFIINSRNPDGHKYIIATCCNPIPGDPVTGFLSPDGTVTVHKKTCSVAGEMASKHGDLVVIPKWEEGVEDLAFPVRITFRGIDRVGLLNEISRYISLVMGLNMRKISFSTDGGIFDGYIDFYVHDKEALDKMIRKLSSIEGIQNVIRTDI